MPSVKIDMPKSDVKPDDVLPTTISYEDMVHLIINIGSRMMDPKKRQEVYDRLWSNYHTGRIRFFVPTGLMLGVLTNDKGDVVKRNQ